jgi:uncharacterized protein (DUF305 family)
MASNVEAVTQSANRQSSARPAIRRRPWRWLLGAIAIAGIVAAALVAWALLPRVPGDASSEAGFARDMIAHHEQAVEMALLIRDRTEDPIIRTMATDMILTQTNQMGQMMGWLDVWGLPLTGAEPPMTWMGHGGQPMPGMASNEEIAMLRELAGTEADVLFLQLMIRHHFGAFPMAEAILDQSSKPAVERLATSIINAQQTEIETMTDLLAERGAEPLS